MPSIIQNITLRLRQRRLFHIARAQHELILWRVYSLSAKSFHEKKLVYCYRLAFTVTAKLLDLEIECAEDINEDDVNSFYESVRHDNWIIENVSKYHLIHAKYYSTFSGEFFEKLMDEALSKAGYTERDVKAIHISDLKRIYKEAKKKKRSFTKQVKTLNFEKINDEKLKVVKPLNVDATLIIFVLSCFSSLFLMGGFFYTNLFFNQFNISVSDFFTLSDYITASLESLVEILIWCLIGFASFLWGLDDRFSETLHDEQFEIETKKRDYFTPIVLINAILGIAITLYLGLKVPKILIVIIVFFAGLQVLIRIKSIEIYINNYGYTLAIIGFLFLFMLYTWSTALDLADEVKSEEYISPYILHLSDGYEQHSDQEFIYSNSNFVFLLNRDSNEVHALPRSSIKSIVARQTSE